MKKIVLSVTSLAMLAGLSFGAPLKWPFHHKAKQDQTTKTTQKQKKSHHWFHHGKSKGKKSKSNAGSAQ